MNYSSKSLKKLKSPKIVQFFFLIQKCSPIFFSGRKIICWESFETVFAEVSDRTELILGGKRSFKVCVRSRTNDLRTDAYGPLRTVKHRILRA